MGGRNRNQRRRGGQCQKRPRDNEWTTDARDEQTLSNAALEKYYRGKIVPEEEWEAFLTAMRTPLPLSMRVNVSLGGASEIADFLVQQLAAVFPTERMPFFPRGLGLQCEASRGELKRNVEHKRIKKIVSALNEGGYLTRQETVSMIPPLLLNAQPGEKILDMCSAPGSKTSQILEGLLSNLSRGVVVANDLNSSRLDVLNHQTNRCSGAQAHLIITNYDAMNYPFMSDANDKFDKVLCDVMCSGDGTLRKSMDLWPRWNTIQGGDLHASQCRVLTRGMQLCKKGGVVVYSTCSLNPVEDEAVLSECLERAKGTFQLIDPAPFLPGLKGDAGVDSWVLTVKSLDKELDSYEAAQSYREEQQGKGFGYRPSMFANTERLRQQNIHFAIRVMPHRQNTGGFFIAALKCIDDYPDSIRPPPSVPTDKTFHPISDALKANVQTALGLPDTFPYANLYVRNEVARELKVYYVNDDVKELLPKLNANIAQVGVKVFESYVKHSTDKLRFAAEGAGSLAPLLPTSFFIPMPASVVLDMISRKGMDAATFVQATGIPSFDSLPPRSFMLQVDIPHGVGTIYIAADRFGATVTCKALEWQCTLCKVAAGVEVCDAAAEKGAQTQEGADGSEDDDCDSGGNDEDIKQPDGDDGAAAN